MVWQKTANIDSSTVVGNTPQTAKINIFAGSFKSAWLLWSKMWRPALIIVAIINVTALGLRVLLLNLLSRQLAVSGTYPNLWAYVLLVLIAIVIWLAVWLTLRLLTGLIQRGLQTSMDSLNLQNIWSSGRKVWRLVWQLFGIFLIAVVIIGVAGVAVAMDSITPDTFNVNILMISLIIMGLAFIGNLPFEMVGFGDAFSDQHKKIKSLIKGHFWSLWWRSFLALVMFMILSKVIEATIYYFDNFWILLVCSFLVCLYFLFLFIYAAVLRNNLPDKDVPDQKIGFYRFGLSLVIVLFVAISGVLIAINSLNQAAADIDKVNNLDLLVKSQAIPEDQNAYYVIYKEFAEKMATDYDAAVADHQRTYYDPQENIQEETDIITGKIYDAEKVNSYLSRNQIYLDRFDQAVKLDRFQDPNYLEFRPDAPTSPLSNLRTMTRLQSLKVAGLIHAKDYQQAVIENNKILKLSHMLLNNDCHVIIQYLVGIVPIYSTGSSVDIGALQVLNRIVAQADFSDQQLATIQNNLEQFNDINEGLTNAIKNEVYGTRSFGIQLLLRSSTELRDFSYYFQANRFKESLAQQARDLATAMNGSWNDYGIYEKKWFSNNQADETLINKLKPSLIFQRNALNFIFTNLSNEVYKNIFEKKLMLDWKIAATKINLADLRYQKANKTWPATLAVLAPDYLKQLPADPFSGEEIRYNQPGHFIYSVGNNLLDDQGNGDDLKFELSAIQ